MADVLVVGGGIIGCSVAIELAENGVSVSLLDEDQPGTGATGASAGMLAPHYEAEPGTDLFHLAVESRQLYPRFVDRLEELGEWEIDFRADGMLVANRSAHEEESARAAIEHGYGAQLLDPVEARALHGDVSSEIPSWLWLPGEGQVNAQLLSYGLGLAVQRCGVDLHRGIQVTGIRARSGRVVGVRSEAGDELDAGRVILAAGAWSGLIDGIPRTLPVRPMRGEMLRLEPERAVPWPLVATHDGHYVVPRENGLVLAGSTMEDRGFETSVTERGTTEIATRASELVPSLEEASVIERWAGLRPISLDRKPVLGPEPRVDGLFYATGHGRNGILLAPITARIVADLVIHGDSSTHWRPFAPDRFSPHDLDSTRPVGRQTRPDSC